MNATEMKDDPEANAARLAAEVQEARAHNRNAKSAAGKKNWLAGTALAGGCLAVAAFMFWPQGDPTSDAPLQTGEPAGFQTTDAEMFPNLNMPQRRQPPAAETVVVDGPDPNPELVTEIEALRAEIERLRTAQPESDSPAPELAAESNDPQIDALLNQLADLQSAMSDMQLENFNAIADRERQMALMQAQLDAARFQTGTVDLGEGGNTGVPDARSEAEVIYRARVASPMIAFGGSASSGGAMAAGDDAVGAAAQALGGIDPNLRRQSANEQFARQQASRAATQQAQVIANPGNTVMQGTMIQAVLETAVNTDLPGAIRAVVAEDIHAVDGSRILIPRGARVIGSYNDNTELGQRRAMIVWNRLILPDNQTVELASYGGDFIGRSGVGGRVNTHFGARFGSAALISLISLAPALALSDAEDDDNASDIADAMAENIDGALQSTLGGYLNRAPTITINQGTLLTIMVDRDLEIF